MTDDTGTLRRIVEHLVDAVRPLARSFRDEGEFQSLMLQLGWDVPGLPPSYLAVAQRCEEALAALEALADDAGVGELLAVAEKSGALYRAIAALTDAPNDIDASQFLPGLADRVFEYVLGRELIAHAPGWFGLLQALGIVSSEHHAATATRPAFGRLRIDWDQIPAILSSPGLIPGRVYGWGTQQLNFTQLALALADIGVGLGLPFTIETLGIDFADSLQADATGPVDRPPESGITFTLFDVPVGDTTVPIGLVLTELPAEGSAAPGLILLPLVPDGIDEHVDLGGGWTLTLRAGTDLTHLLGVVARPDGLSVRYPGSPGHAPPSAGFGVAVEFAPAAPALLFGEPGTTRLEQGGARASASLDLRNGDVELAVKVSVNGLSLIVSPAGADGFLGTVLGDGDLRVDIPFELAWSSRTGLQFQTGAGFQVTVHPGVDIGLLRIDRVDVGLRLSAGTGTTGLALQALAAVSGGLGPFSYAIDRLGTELAAGFQPGNAGPFDLALRPVWPTGVGLALEAAAVSGGGFLRYDPQTGRYAGAFDLIIADVIAVKAIGLITTKLPSGRPGFALLLMITAEGFTPIQLGMGFMLTGVGGLVALNRTIDADAVRRGLSNGVLDSVLFAKDPVANADRILSILDTIFPTAPDRLLLGPLAEISWGSPTILKARLALLLEIPQPVRAVLLAAVSVLLPDPDDAIVELHVDAIGVLDLSRGELAVDASLHHSRLANFTLTGDLAARLNWGDDPQFLVSAGGFHPRFTPPAGLRPLRRMMLSLSDRDNPRIRFESYLALTANTIQFGARATLRAEAGGFGVDGGGAFDALVQWSPFGVDVLFDAWVRVFSPAGTLFSAQLSVAVTGPQPWHVAGTLTIHLLFFSIHAGVDFTIGAAQPPRPVDTVDLLTLLRNELTRPQSWTAAVPRTIKPGVTLQPQTGPDTVLVVHPLGSVSIRQKLVPLGTLVTRYGAARPKDGPRTYDLDVQSPAGIAAQPVLDHFAPAQFTEQSDDQKLVAPSFALLPAGLTFEPSASGVPAIRAVGIDLTHESLDLTELEVFA